MAPSQHEIHQTLDTSGQLCPEPILHARRALDGMQGGEVLEVVATDPHAELDFEVFCARTGHQLLEVTHAEGQWRFRIRRQDSPA